eukprot:976819-Pleurochrysis_carterae.AAC.2
MQAYRFLHRGGMMRDGSRTVLAGPSEVEACQLSGTKAMNLSIRLANSVTKRPARLFLPLLSGRLYELLPVHLLGRAMRL